MKKLVQREDAPKLAQLMNLKSFGDLELDHHYTTWSMVDYLVSEHPEGFARLLRSIKGLTNAEGFPDGTRVRDVHRAQIKELAGSYLAFDRAWRAWVLETY